MKRVTSITVETKILDQAKAKGINFSQVCEQALALAVEPDRFSEDDFWWLDEMLAKYFYKAQRPTNKEKARRVRSMLRKRLWKGML